MSVRAAEIGEPIREITVQPLTVPVPEVLPVPSPKPVKVPEEEPVHA